MTLKKFNLWVWRVVVVWFSGFDFDDVDDDINENDLILMMRILFYFIFWFFFWVIWRL